MLKQWSLALICLLYKKEDKKECQTSSGTFFLNRQEIDVLQHSMVYKGREVYQGN